MDHESMTIRACVITFFLCVAACIITAITQPNGPAYEWVCQNPQGLQVMISDCTSRDTSINICSDIAFSAYCTKRCIANCGTICPAAEKKTAAPASGP